MSKTTRGGRRRRSGSRRVKRGGDGAASYMLKTVGTGDQQYNNVFSQGTPGQSNAVVGLQGQKAGKSRRRRGGLWGPVINQAVVPASILALQQSYKRKRGGKKTRRHHRR